MYLATIIIGSIIIGISKALADITDHSDNWSGSVFSVNHKEDSFFGPKDKTWVRKDNDNKIINWLFHYPLVWLTDIWHLSNSFRTLGYFLVLFGFYNMLDFKFIICLVIHYCTKQLLFNLFYHYILIKHEKNK